MWRKWVQKNKLLNTEDRHFFCENDLEYSVCIRMIYVRWGYMLHSLFRVLLMLLWHFALKSCFFFFTIIPTETCTLPSTHCAAGPSHFHALSHLRFTSSLRDQCAYEFQVVYDIQNFTNRVIDRSPSLGIIKSILLTSYQISCNRRIS